MKRQPQAKSVSGANCVRGTLWVWAAVLAGVLTCAAPFAGAQGEPPEPPEIEPQPATRLPDPFLPKINAAIQTVTTSDSAALAKALRLDKPSSGASAGSGTLAAVGDLDGDGVPEILLKLAMPDASEEGGSAPAPDSQPLWALYLLSWDGGQWQVSPLLTGVEDYNLIIVNLGSPVGRGLALVVWTGHGPTAYPVVFQVKEHAATLLWDSQADDSRYEPLFEGQVSFHDAAAAPAEMVVSGRADPGLLRVTPHGKRGFNARAVYRWEGTAFVPLKTEFSPDEDYTIYRFISALHLHDYRSAYLLVASAEFLKTGSPTLDAFRRDIQDNWLEFLQDEVFAAPEATDSADEHAFVLSKPDKRYVYHPRFSKDGKFLLTGLSRTLETVSAEP